MAISENLFFIAWTYKVRSIFKEFLNLSKIDRTFYFQRCLC